jgi:hypothetical protein
MSSKASKSSSVQRKPGGLRRTRSTLPALSDMLETVQGESVSDLECRTGLSGDKLAVWVRRYCVALLYLQRVSQNDMSKLLGVNVATVNNDVYLLRKGWHQEFSESSEKIRSELDQCLIGDESLVRECILDMIGAYRSARRAYSFAVGGKSVSVDGGGGDEIKSPKQPNYGEIFRGIDRLLRIYELRMRLYRIDDAPSGSGGKFSDNRSFVQYNFERFVPGGGSGGGGAVEGGKTVSAVGSGDGAVRRLTHNGRVLEVPASFDDLLSVSHGLKKGVGSSGADDNEDTEEDC